MDTVELAGLIDNTILRADAAEKEIAGFVERSASLGFATVCVPPCHVALAVRLLAGFPTRVSTVAGFPLGFHTPEVKALEARKACEAGASEIDMVMNISLLKSGNTPFVEDEIGSVVRAIDGAVLKVIIETCCLTDAEKLASVEAAVSAGAAFVKTSTGFGTKGAEARDVELLARAAAGRIKVKASGGIKTLSSALSMIEAGAARIGTSSGAAILDELTGRAR